MILGALDIGGSKTLVGLISEEGQVLSSVQLPTNTSNCKVHLQQCRAQLAGLAKAAGMPLGALAGVGAALPGVVDVNLGGLVKSSYAAWNGVPVAPLLGDMLGGLPVKVDNDVNACALAEMRFGWQNTFTDYVWVTVSTGVGGAVVTGGKLLRGAWGAAGEIGHIKVEYEHPAPCPSCGKVGCLEAHGSGLALGQALARQCKYAPQLAMAMAGRGLEPSGKTCALLAEEGEPHALAAFAQIGRYLGRGLGAAVNLLNPQAIIFGGGVAMSLHFLYNAIEKELCKAAHPNLLPVKLVPTKLGYQAALIGAAALL